MLSTVSDAADAAVLPETLVTVKLTPAGTVTRACSLTVAVNVVVWLVSVRLTDCCAKALGATPSTMAAPSIVLTKQLILIQTPGVKRCAGPRGTAT